MKLYELLVGAITVIIFGGTIIKAIDITKKDNAIVEATSKSKAQCREGVEAINFNRAKEMLTPLTKKEQSDIYYNCLMAKKGVI